MQWCSSRAFSPSLCQVCHGILVETRQVRIMCHFYCLRTIVTADYSYRVIATIRAYPMNYYPYLRGNISDMLAMRDTAKLMARHNFTPIIEPNPDHLSGVSYTIRQLNVEKVKPIVMLNPRSEKTNRSEFSISDYQEQFGESNEYTLGLQLHPDLSSDQALEICSKVGDRKIALVHSGFQEINGFVDKIRSYPNVTTNIFIDSDCGKLYMEKFDFLPASVLIRDGIRYRSEYRRSPAFEFFSDLHITYGKEKVVGFGDFLAVGRETKKHRYPEGFYSINLTYFEPERDNAMFVYHFQSDTDASPKSTGALFLSALSNLVRTLDSPYSKISSTKAIEKFRKLNEIQRYPGVSFVRQLILTHHIETLSQYEKQNGDV